MVRRDAEADPAGARIPSFIQRFEVLEVLGRGGMGIVYRARDPRLDRDVAIKVLSSRCEAPADLSSHRTIDLHAPGPPAQDELIAEARVMAQLSHPNVLAVYEVGLDGDSIFLVMEYVAGANLRDWSASSTRTRAELLDVFAQAGRGLVAAHACGIVHRDFKPENVLVGADRVRVADFGLSRLSRPPTAWIWVAEERGTPEYMAPELWRAVPATTHSDVFAFCTALVEGLLGRRPGEAAAVEPELRERGVSPELCAAIRAGLDDDPARRPELSRIVELLDDRPRSHERRWILALAGAAVAAVAVGAVFVASSTDGPACSDDRALLAGRWDAEQRGKLTSYLQASTTPATDEGTRRVLAILDDHAREIAALRTTTCVAADDGELVAAQVAIRMSCLERRALALGIAAQEIRDSKLDLDAAERRAHAVPYVTACAELTAPPIRDLDRAAALHTRYFAITPLASAARAQAYAELEHEALAAGEVELAVQTAIVLALMQRDTDQITTADETLQRAYRRALEIKAEGLAARALVERANLAAKHTPAAAASTAQLALALADRPGVSARTRVRIYGSLGRAALARGDAVAARTNLQRALDVIATHDLAVGASELDIRFDLVRALQGFDNRQALEVARSAIAFAKRTSGEHSANYGTALNMLASTLWSEGDLEQALQYRKQSLEVISAALPSDHSRVVTQRINLTWDLQASGRYDEARRESAAALAQIERNEGLRGSRAEVLYMLAIATFGVGEYDEGLRLGEQAYVESMSRVGKDHPTTLHYLHNGLLDMELELGRFDAVEKHVAILEEAYRANPQPRDVRPIMLRSVFAAQLAIARGTPRDAEALARAALPELAERKADRSRPIVLTVLGRSLLAQRRWAEAKTVLEEALAITQEHKRRVDHLAIIESLLAQAEHGHGQHEVALQRARRARDVLASTASQPRGSAEIAAFLAKHDRRR